MTYYRVALRTDETAEWRWKSTVVTSLESIIGLIRLYRSVPRDRIRVFFFSSVEFMNDMLARENEGLASNSVTAEEFLSGKTISPVEIARLESGLVLHKKVTVSAVVATASMVNEKRMHTNGAAFSALDMRRLEIEPGQPGDHDTPYMFTLPVSMPQTLAWLKLMLKVQSGELES